jgi:hypothetical protein
MMNVSISGGSSANHSSLHDLSSLSAIGNAMDNSSLGGNEENPVIQQHNAGINLVRAVGRHLYLDNIELWQSIKMDEYRQKISIVTCYVILLITGVMTSTFHILRGFWIYCAPKQSWSVQSMCLGCVSAEIIILVHMHLV